MSYYNQIVVIKKTEYPKNVTATLNSNLIKSIGSFHVLEINLGNPLQIFNHSQSSKYFILNLSRLGRVEILKIIPVEKEFALFVHFSKIDKVVQLDNRSKGKYSTGIAATLLNEIKKTKLQTYIPQAGINILLQAVGLFVVSRFVF